MIKKYIFCGLAIIGILIISVCTFTIPNNPNETIKALTPMTFDRPLWLNIIIGFGSLYLIIIYGIYNYLGKEKN